MALNACCRYIHLADLSLVERERFDKLDISDLEGTDADGNLVSFCSHNGHAYVYSHGHEQFWDLTGRTYIFVVTRTVRSVMEITACNKNDASSKVWDALRDLPDYNPAEYSIRLDLDKTEFPYE